jgi:hypothetical protein
VPRADNLTNFMCQLSLNLAASTSWNPQVLSRPVMGLLALNYCYSVMHYIRVGSDLFMFNSVLLR